MKNVQLTIRIKKEDRHKTIVKLITLSILTSLIVISNCAQAQNWTLQSCIDTALQNNFSIQSSRIQNQLSEIHLKSSKQSLLPSLNAGVSHGYNWGQTIDLFTNQFATDRVMFDNFYLNSSISLFSGLQNYYTIKANQIASRSGELDLEVSQRNVKIDVSAAFSQVLLNEEIVKISIENSNQTQRQYDRMSILIEENQATQSQLLEIDAQLQTDKYNILKAQNDLHYSQLLLQQLMNVVIQDSIHLVPLMDDSQLKNYDVEEISKLPEITLQELIIQQQEYELKAIKGRYFPSLGLSGSMGSGYSGNDKFIDGNNNFITTPFRDQINNNLYESVILTLSIPIFNANKNRNQVKIKELEINGQEVKNQQDKQNLLQKIEQIRTEIRNLIAQINALKKVLLAAHKNLDNFRIRYENKEVTYTEFVESQNKLLKAKSDLVQAEYQMKFKKIILGYYKGE